MPQPGHLSEVLFPARDVGFGTLVRQLSEPETGPPADNLITNEDSFPRVVGELARSAPPGGIYLGVGPDQNLTYIAQARPTLAFVLDYRRRNQLLHLLHKALLQISPDRVAYLTRLTARRPVPLAADPSAAELVRAFAGAALDRGLLDATVAEVAEVLRPLGLVDEVDRSALASIQARLAGPGLEARFLALRMYPTFGRLIATSDRDGRPAHFLAREPLYQAVRQAQCDDRVLPLVGDFASPTALPRLGDWLRRHKLAVGVLYVSDVEFFLLRSGKFAAYVANLARLPWREGAVLIRSSTREIDHPERVPGDSSTTILRPVAPFLEAARGGRIREVDDLFR